MAEETGIQRMHRINRLLLRKLDEVCERNHIIYYLDSGGLIGAVRHKDLIPWDDDVDVAFPRPEYEKLLALPQSEWGEDFCLVPWDRAGEGAFLDFDSRLVYRREEVPLSTYDKLGERCNPELKNRVPLDCFVLDTAAPTERGFRRQVFRLRFAYFRLLRWRGKLDFSDYPGLSGLAVRLCAALGALSGREKLMARFQRIAQSVPPECSAYYFYSNYSIGHIGKRYRKEWYASRVRLPLGPDEFWAPAGYDAVLTREYGDYMTPPPEHQRSYQHLNTEEN